MVIFYIVKIFNYTIPARSRYTIPCAVIATAQGCTVQAISRLFCRSRVTFYCQTIQFISLYLTVSLVVQNIIWYVNKVGTSHNNGTTILNSRHYFPDNGGYLRFQLNILLYRIFNHIVSPSYFRCSNVSSSSSEAISLLHTRIRLSSLSSFPRKFILPYQTISISMIQ